MAGNSSAHNGDVALAYTPPARSTPRSAPAASSTPTSVERNRPAASCNRGAIWSSPGRRTARARRGVHVQRHARYDLRQSNGSSTTAFSAWDAGRSRHRGGSRRRVRGRGKRHRRPVRRGGVPGVRRTHFSFASTGTVTGAFLEATDDDGGVVQIQSNGQIVTMGTAGPDPGSSSRASGRFSRYNADGSLDTTFGTGGHLIEPAQGLLRRDVHHRPPGPLRGRGARSTSRSLSPTRSSSSGSTRTVHYRHDVRAPTE